MRWLDGITGSMDMGLGGLQELVMDGGSGMLWFMGSQDLGTTERLNWTELNWKSIDQNFNPFFLILWHILWKGLSHFISSMLGQLQFYLLCNKLDIGPATAEVSPTEWFYWLFEDIPLLIHNSILYISLSLSLFSFWHCGVASGISVP